MKSILLTLSLSLYLATCNAATAQPVPSSVEAHTVNGITSATTFPGSDIGAKVNGGWPIHKTSNVSGAPFMRSYRMSGHSRYA
jgi:hypothetical protein